MTIRRGAFGGYVGGRSVVGAVLLSGAVLLPAIAVAAQPLPPVPFENPAFKKVWERADYPVVTGKAQRSWLWGPGPIAATREPLAESPEGMRQVQYYDKARMEINDPNADPNSMWYVTNGLLVYEMISGRMQIGNDKFEQREPASIPVAGGPSMQAHIDTTPTYASLGRVATLAPGQNQAPDRTGQPVDQTYLLDGTIGKLPTAANPPKLQHYEKTTGHNIPDVFWSFMNQRGVVYEDGQFKDGLAFNWVYAMGYPLTEPYWMQININGAPTNIMVQAFQRRLLTYNPTNAPPWRVEMGNVGVQYYQWRYGQTPPPLPGQNPSRGTVTTLNIRRVDLPGTFANRQYSVIHTPLYTTAINQAEWNAIWQRHTAELDAFIPAPKVNVDTEFVVAVFAGNKPNSCYRLNVQSVVQKQNNIVVMVDQVVRTDLACAQVIVQPNDMVAVSKANLSSGAYNVTFVDANNTQLSTTNVTLP